MARVSDAPIKTFSIGFDDEAYNELKFARQVADLYGTEHHELIVKPDIENVLPKIARMFDEPFTDSSAVPSFFLAEMARREVVVALNDDGGDELFGRSKPQVGTATSSGSSMMVRLMLIVLPALMLAT
jgi:asparagine synthase (glutamine-hydrolysing)